MAGTLQGVYLLERWIEFLSVGLNLECKNDIEKRINTGIEAMWPVPESAWYCTIHTIPTQVQFCLRLCLMWHSVLRTDYYESPIPACTVMFLCFLSVGVIGSVM